MPTPKIIGDPDGIKLWNMMAVSDNLLEQEFFQRLNTAAAKTGRVYFSDFVTHLETKMNQAMWRLEWNGSDWNVSLFHIPDGVKKVSNRIQNFGVQTKAEEVDFSDLIKG